MVFLDSNIFVIDRFFKRDVKYGINKYFLDSIEKQDVKASIPYFTLLEICGVASFNLSVEELERWLYTFGDIYPVQVLDPHNEKDNGRTGTFLLRLSSYVARRMTLGDAVLLMEAENYGAVALVSWNKKHFERHTAIPVYTPEEYLSVEGFYA